MKVIHFITSIDKKDGGTASYISLLSNKLGLETELYIVTSPTNTPVDIKNAQVISICLNIKKYTSVINDMNKIIRKINPDIVHINGIWEPQTWWFQNIAQKKNIKVIITPHGMLEPWILSQNKWKKNIALFFYQRKAIRKADYLHATALMEKNNLLKLNYNNNIEIIPNGIDVEKISIKNNWNKTKNILFMSRIHPKKGIEILIDTVNLIRDKLLDYKFIIAGEGDIHYLDFLINKVKGLDLDNLFEFKGGVYEGQKWNLLQRADLFILPTFSENFGIVVAEALASGTPVITTKGTPWKELSERNCGLWIDLNIENLKNAILDFINLNEKDLEMMGKAGRQLIEEKYNTKIMSDHLKTLYQKVNKTYY